MKLDGFYGFGTFVTLFLDLLATLEQEKTTRMRRKSMSPIRVYQLINKQKGPKILDIPRLKKTRLYRNTKI